LYVGIGPQPHADSADLYQRRNSESFLRDVALQSDESNAKFVGGFTRRVARFHTLTYSTIRCKMRCKLGVCGTPNYPEWRGVADTERKRNRVKTSIS
jgi:hypothetical protein